MAFHKKKKPSSHKQKGPPLKKNLYVSNRHFNLYITFKMVYL